MLGGNHDWFAHAELENGGQVDLGVVEIDLVDDHAHDFAAAAQHAGDAVVERRHALAAVEQEQDERRGRDGKINLLLRGRDELPGRFAALEPDAAGVEERVAPLLDLGRDDVAGDARLVMHDGNALPRQPVEQAAFAHIGASDDGDGANHRGVRGTRSASDREA